MGEVMIIYGVALLAFCTVAGLFLGNILGSVLGVEANVGGVGIAMILLLWLQHIAKKKVKSYDISAKGIIFWSSMYIPIVVAMAAKQNVVAATSAGTVAILSGVLAVAVSFALVPIMTKWALKSQQKIPSQSNKGDDK
jgi:malonate transporter MadL subunit